MYTGDESVPVTPLRSGGSAVGFVELVSRYQYPVTHVVHFGVLRSWRILRFFLITVRITGAVRLGVSTVEEMSTGKKRSRSPVCTAVPPSDGRGIPRVRNKEIKK